MEERNLTCIGCPLGCALKVTIDGEKCHSNRKYLQARSRLRSKGSDTSDANRDKHSLCEKRHNTYGIRKDSTGYSKGKDNGCDGLYQPDHGRGTGAYR